MPNYVQIDLLGTAPQIGEDTIFMTFRFSWRRTDWTDFDGWWLQRRDLIQWYAFWELFWHEKNYGFLASKNSNICRALRVSNHRKTNNFSTVWDRQKWQQTTYGKSGPMNRMVISLQICHVHFRPKPFPVRLYNHKPPPKIAYIAPKRQDIDEKCLQNIIRYLFILVSPDVAT